MMPDNDFNFLKFTGGGGQLESDYVESSTCVHPNCFPGKCLENAHLLGTWPQVSNAIFIGRTDAEAETPVLWSPDAKS